MSGPFWYPLPDPSTAAHRASTAFARAYGRAPDGVWAAPGRVNVIGEHVDYNGGVCLPFALAHRTYVALAARDDGRLRVRSVQADAGGGIHGPAFDGTLDAIAPGTVHGWAAYAVGVPWALREIGLPTTGFDAMVDGHVPVGSGLSSSAAMECAVAVGLAQLTGTALTDDDQGRALLAGACVRAENDIAGVPTGGMDQAAALRCSPGHALLLDCRDFTAVAVPFDPSASGLEVLVTDTRAHHALADGRYGSRRAACRDAAALLGLPDLAALDPTGLAEALGRLSTAVQDPEQADEMVRRVRHVVTEIDRVRAVVALLRDDRLDRIGPVLDASHASLRDDFEVSVPELDLACATARDGGALGARMTGGGFGGSTIALVETAQVVAVAARTARAFAAAGMAAPAFLRAVPGGAAARVS